MDGQEGEYPAFVGNVCFEDHIEGGDAVRGDEEESVVVDSVELADFAGGEEGKVRLEVCVRHVEGDDDN